MPDTRPQIIDLEAERQRSRELWKAERQRSRETSRRAREIEDALAKWVADTERRETRRAMAWTAVNLVILAAFIAAAFLVTP